MSNPSNIKKSLFSGLFWIVLANLIVKPFWILGVDRGVQNAVDTETYGLYFVVFNLAYIFNILLDLGVTNFNVRNIAQHPSLIRKHLSGILSIKLLLLVLYLVVTLTVGLLLGYDSRSFMLLVWLSVNQFLNSLIIFLRSNFEGLLLFRLDSLFSVLDRLLMIVICGFLLWGPIADGFQIEWFVYAQTVAYVITAGIALVALARRTGLRRLHFSRPFTLAILKQSAPYALLVLLMASYNRLDPVLLNWLCGADGGSQAGIYAGAFRLLDALTMIAYLVSVPLLPIYSKLTKTKDNKEIAVITKLLFSAMLCFSLTVSVVCCADGLELMGLMYDSHVQESTPVFSVLIFGIIPISMTYIFGTLLTANGSLKWLNIFAASTLVVNVVLNLLLIPRLHAQGSAWASLGAQSLMALLQMALALKIFNIKPSIRYTILIIFYVIMVVLSGRIVFDVVDSALAKAVIVAAVSLLFAFAFRLINVRELLQIIKTKTN